MDKREISVILYDRFEILDALGPAEMLASLPAEMTVECYSEFGGPVRSTQNVTVETWPFEEIPSGSTLLIPGGIGQRSVSCDPMFLEKLKKLCEEADYVLTVCTGSSLLARTGLLDGKVATTNKKVFSWVQELTPAVLWQKKARWTVDGRYYTSSGVSAGMDMAVAFIADRYGKDKADTVIAYTEYVWNDDKDNDPFAAS